MLCIGAAIGGLIGPSITKKSNAEKLKLVIGIPIILGGAWTIIKLVTGIAAGGGG